MQSCSSPHKANRFNANFLNVYMVLSLRMVPPFALACVCGPDFCTDMLSPRFFRLDDSRQRRKGAEAADARWACLRRGSQRDA